jgi:hypothetical protein
MSLAKNRPKRNPTKFFSQNKYLILPWNKVAEVLATSVIFKITNLSLESPNRQKFAQSGHTDQADPLYTWKIK